MKIDYVKLKEEIKVNQRYVGIGSWVWPRVLFQKVLKCLYKMKRKSIELENDELVIHYTTESGHGWYRLRSDNSEVLSHHLHLIPAEKVERR